jgi:hypothetical protein
MLALTIEDIKSATRELFVGDLFDRFLCTKVVIHQGVDYTIDGKCNLEFYDTEEQETRAALVYTAWEEIKPIAFQMIRGHRLPLSFQIVLCAAPSSVEKLLKHTPCPLTQDQIEGLFINLHYKDERLTLTTGSSYTVFTMDKSLDHAFEDAVKKLIRTRDIAFRE